MSYKNITKFGKIIVFVITIMFYSCGKPMTSSIFMQTKRVEILIPTDEEERNRSTILSEKVNYQQKIDTIKPDKAAEKEVKADVAKSLELQEVTVTSNRPKIKISNIRNGYVTLNFLISVPKVFMNPDYRVVMTPSLINGDTTQVLDPIVLMGSKLKEYQDADYKKLSLIDSSIVDQSKYDSVFFNRKKHDKFMKNLEYDYLLAYYADYSQMVDYIRWYNIMQNRFDHFNAVTEGKYEQRANDKALKALNKIYRAKVSEKDTTKYAQEYEKNIKKADKENYIKSHRREINMDILPSKFESVYHKGPHLDSLYNFSATELDSIKVAKHTYNYVSIAKNESLSKTKEQIEANMPFKKVDNVKKYFDIKPDTAITIMYTQQIPVTESLAKKLQVSMSTRVLATDKSTWHQNCMDTLSFIVTGLNDLADSTMLEAYKYNENYYNDYKAGLERLRVRDYTGALTILRFYPDYNASICLVALGMNDKALELLEKIPETGKSLYLKSIVLVRLGKLDEARSSLVDACKKESFLGYKADIEPELSKILEDDSFRQRIQDIADGLEF